MSYILDALRRADSERERKRGGVPGLHSQAVPPADDEPAAAQASGKVAPHPRPTALPPWAWMAVGVGVALLAALIWRQTAGPAAPDAPEPSAPTPPAPLQAETPTAPPPPVAAIPADALPAAPRQSPPAPLAPQLAPPPPAQPPSPRPAPQPAPPAPAPAPAFTQATQPPVATLPASPPPAAPTTAPPPSTTPTAPRIHTLDELPDDVRRSLPRLAVNGSAYSDVRANRILILNGQVFHEGDQPAPGVRLEEIRLKSAVLQTRGYRYEITY